MNTDTWYFAYGSNLSIDQKELRTGRIRRAVRCRLPGHRFAFNKRGSNGDFKANVVPDEREETWGVIYLCNRAAMNELDKYEGVAGGHYRRHSVQVITDSGEKVDAVAYVAQPRFVAEDGEPNSDYLGRILTGARQHELPEEYIRNIEATARTIRG